MPVVFSAQDLPPSTDLKMPRAFWVPAREAFRTFSNHVDLTLYYLAQVQEQLGPYSDLSATLKAVDKLGNSELSRKLQYFRNLATGELLDRK